MRPGEDPAATPPRPRVSAIDAGSVAASVQQIMSSGELTNGAVVRRLERRAAAYLGVRHCVAVASGTAGLMVALRAADLDGEVVLPSFTSPATVHAALWSGLEPVFADIDPMTLSLTADTVAEHVGTRTGAILATHPLGAPCDTEGLAKVAATQGLRVIFDAAAAFGAVHENRMVGGFGDAEVFSLSSTKMLMAGEGGLIATDDDLLAERCRRARDETISERHPSRLVCMNARMSELHAAVALASFDTLEERLDRRRALAQRYRSSLEGVVGLTWPHVEAGDLSTYREMTVLIDPEVFGMSADATVTALNAQGVEAGRTWPDPVHRIEMYRYLSGAGELDATETAAARTVSLPLWDDMPVEELDATAAALCALASQ
jgi:dTDP-4-amino-4,6-dideoxygalactose transaminase